MQKKWLVMAAGVGIGALLLVQSGLSVKASGSGYEAYKSAVKNMHSIASVTADVSVSVADNGTNVLNIESSVKASRQQEAASADVRVNAGTEDIAISTYREKDKTIVKTGDSDLYRVIEDDGKERKHRDRGDKPFAESDMEHVLDALMGQLRNQVTMEASRDGGKLVSLHLDGSQIPAAVNAIGALMLKHAGGSHPGDFGPWHNQPESAEASPDFRVDLPKLTDAIQVQSIHLDAVIDKDNYIERQTATVVVTGKDAGGAEHEIAVTLNAGLSALNRTVPDTVDLNGKNVETIKPELAKHSWRRS
ncbi:hypothetical protein [Paenibacillus sp. MSJ-34]|uniref:hypothetical protein n=1 Tax=Paenibacillus sp. MSJ-34 TaxID=2841529 RepID=UPI001C123B5F|nr:hypothetical protein [Paenibacillus sp. MSJ-34]MBU5441162.1 hypothetical protein [Paenibacillus sp. MSJ-34]